VLPIIGVASGGPKGPWPRQILENIVILCFERRFSKQSSVFRLKSDILSPRFFIWPPQIFGLATALLPITLCLEHTSQNKD